MTGLRMVWIVSVMLSLAGCAVNERSFWPVADAEMYWPRPGFSVQAPGTNWYRNPINQRHPDSIVFTRGEGITIGGMTDKPVYMRYAMVSASGSRLKGLVVNREDKNQLAATLRKYLFQHTNPITITDSGYDHSLGFDCLKYSGTPKEGRRPIPGGEVKELPVDGFFCLHPDSDQYAVVMEGHNYSTSGGKIPFVDEQVHHFFKSLRFATISSATSRKNRGH